ncbi:MULTISPECIES: LysR family transcriptional regulator [Agrobacterium]|uniref:LysR family transcriptional regulator n=1 Tax=Agrobacterium TaxID=357 RepID=UPI0020B1F1C1|nr:MULTISPECIES: LysR family transcriptional regulator [Agrobacterium]MDA5639336.1 LysR family transcriptional regulator [Agrobacterium sp. ST15.13.013]MDA6999189.1 LysR family transcriptional regulator [Agrobacterium salinitolerans]
MSDTLAFVEVVERGSFTAAAESLRTSKARISKKVQDLEQRLGVKLLHRTTRNIRLTEAGSIYFDRCRDLARLIGDAESAVEQVHGKPSGWLRVTAPHWLVTKALAPLMVGFREAYPEVKLQLLLDHDVKNIVHEDIDVACRLWNGPMPDSNLAARRLADFQTGLYASRKYIQQHGVPEHPSQLKDHACLVTQLFYGRPQHSWPLTRQSEVIDFPINPAVVATDPEALFEFLIRGQGIQLTNPHLVHTATEAGDLVRILPEWSGPSATLYAVRAGGRVQPLKVRSFIDYLSENMENVLRLT